MLLEQFFDIDRHLNVKNLQVLRTCKALYCTSPWPMSCVHHPHCSGAEVSFADLTQLGKQYEQVEIVGNMSEHWTRLYSWPIAFVTFTSLSYILKCE